MFRSLNVSLVPDWRRSWRWLSMHVAGAQALLTATQLSMHQYGQQFMTPTHYAASMGGLAVLLAAVRLVKQGDSTTG